MKAEQRERVLKIADIKARCAELHLMVQNVLQQIRNTWQISASPGQLMNFSIGDFVSVTLEEFSAGEKFARRWRGPRRVIQVISDCVYQVEDLGNGRVEKIDESRLKFYHDASLNTVAIMSHALSFETGMPVARRLKRVLKKLEFFLFVRLKGLPNS